VRTLIQCATVFGGNVRTNTIVSWCGEAERERYILPILPLPSPFKSQGVGVTVAAGVDVGSGVSAGVSVGIGVDIKAL
jgi:hypothetical protein